MLSALDRERYQRQIALPDWGECGQEKLRAATVCIAGVGGLGSPVAVYLAAAGVGRLRLCDADGVSLSNLNRQFLYTVTDIGSSKVKAACDRLRHLNPAIELDIFDQRLEQKTVARIVGESTVIVDCLDNLATRRLLNRYAVRHRIPFLYAGVSGMAGMASLFRTPRTPCFNCIFPMGSETHTAPIVGAAAGVIGSIQALETLKYLVGLETPLMGKLLTFDGLTMTFETIHLTRNATCPICSAQAERAVLLEPGT
jgi:molybdopterin-synthase adenylyltransferase